jgi:hypothetical protein
MKNFVVLNRLPNERLNYESVIDHANNKVTYIGYFSQEYTFKGPATLIEADLSKLDAANLPDHIHQTLLRCDELIARSEFDLLLAAQLREIYNIVGKIRVETLPIRDKFIMRRLAAARGIRQPAFWSLRQFGSRNIEGKTFALKPTLEASSNGIFVGDYQEVLEKIRGIDKPEQWMIEAYVAGEVCHIDGFIESGEIKAIQLSQYVNTCLSYASGSPLGSAQLPNQKWVSDLTSEIAHALSYRDGSFHLEVIIGEDKLPYFLEFAGRVGGGYIGRCFEMKTGIDLHRCDLDLLLGKTIDWSVLKDDPNFFGFFVFPYGASIAPSFSKEDFSHVLHTFIMSNDPAAPTGTSYLDKNSPLTGIVYAKTDCRSLVIDLIGKASNC